MAKTPIFDWERGEFLLDAMRRVVTADESTDPQAVVEQIVAKASQTPRGEFLIYASDDPENDHKYGSDARAVLAADVDQETRISELKEAAREALIYDPRIIDVTDVTVRVLSNSAEVSATVHSIYGTTTRQGVEV